MKQFGNQVVFTCGEIENMYLQNEMFDAAICFATFPHFHEKKSALENTFKLLKLGGKRYICHTASRERIIQIHKQILELLDHLIPSPDEMGKMMRDASYSTINIEEEDNSYLVKCVK
jgi:ubiquinone/menaquinone biosynthesis C-methylase UbiE